MKSMARAVGLGVAIGLSMNALHADAAPDPSTIAREQAVVAQQKAAAHAEWLRQAAIGRQAVAQRYGSCAISSLVDHHESRQQGATPYDGKPRDQVSITLHVAETPAALAQETKYDKDDSVLWEPVSVMARERVPGQHGVNALGTTIPGQWKLDNPGHATTLTQTFYPYATRTSGNVGIFVGEEVETSDFDGQHKYTDYGAKYCGTMVLNKLTDGGYEWQVDPTAEPMDDIFLQRDCALEADPQQPGVFSSDC